MWDFAIEVENETAATRPASPNPGDTVEEAGSDAVPGRRKMGAMVAAGIAMVTLVGTGVVYLQGTPTAVSNPNPQPVIAEPLAPVAVVAAPTAEPVRFSAALKSLSPDIAGRSLAELVMSPATFPPVAGLPVAAWREEKCSSCHNWTQAALCDQGKWYDTHGDAATRRMDHPYGGEFKRTLQTWAAQGCQ